MPSSHAMRSEMIDHTLTCQGRTSKHGELPENTDLGLTCRFHGCYINSIINSSDHLPPSMTGVVCGMIAWCFSEMDGVIFSCLISHRKPVITVDGQMWCGTLHRSLRSLLSWLFVLSYAWRTSTPSLSIMIFRMTSLWIIHKFISIAKLMKSTPHKNLLFALMNCADDIAGD